MTRFLIRRLLSVIPVLFVVSLVTFFILWLVPGDITAEIGGPDATAADLQAIRARLGLDRPLWQRAIQWYGQVLQGDLGQPGERQPGAGRGTWPRNGDSGRAGRRAPSTRQAGAGRQCTGGAGGRIAGRVAGLGAGEQRKPGVGRPVAAQQ
jgi:hypothetical protein